ncbi:sigma-70 family RNA polymerase sigma factor [Nonomuraea bangladeshensis]|uniref:sigma-70 family RNA polymerase sigma factor n=1 Tax=Nonomuraea bangladeshensis TaxID=404385 RepID=UPI003C2FB5B7
MNEEKELIAMFEAHRDHLRAVAYRMLGSLSEADDAVQETWLRLERTDVRDVVNLGGWLTTVVGRVCLNLLRSRRTRGEEPLEPTMPDPVVTSPEGVDPEHEALLSDSVGLALLVVLQTLEPAERLAFVLHDMFAVPFDEIAPIVDRTPAATRQLASRARRRVRDGAVTPDPDLARQREVVDAFMAASRAGDFDALVAVLDPDVVLRADAGGAPRTWLEVRGALEVAGRAFMFRRFAAYVRPVLVNGVAGVVTAPEGRPLSVMAFTVAGGRVVALDILQDEDRLAALLGA